MGGYGTHGVAKRAGWGDGEHIQRQGGWPGPAPAISMAPTGTDQAQNHLLAPMLGTHNHHNRTCTWAHTLISTASLSWAACLAITSPPAAGTIPSFIPSVLLCLCFQLPGFFHHVQLLSLKPPKADNAIASPVPACTWGQADPRHFCCYWLLKAPHDDLPPVQTYLSHLPVLLQGAVGFPLGNGQYNPKIFEHCQEPQWFGAFRAGGETG